MSTRYFTFDEATALIPRLERIFTAAVDIRAKAEAKADAIRGLESKDDADPAQLAIERSQLLFLSRSLEEALRGISELGAVLKGLEPALVDFPFKLRGRDVYLCWKFGEKALRHYHGFDEGFAERKPLPKDLLPH